MTTKAEIAERIKKTVISDPVLNDILDDYLDEDEDIYKELLPNILFTYNPNIGKNGAIEYEIIDPFTSKNIPLEELRKDSLKKIKALLLGEYQDL